MSYSTIPIPEDGTPMQMNPVELALSQYGVSEVINGDNNIILNYSKEAGIDGITNDEISWCSIFVNWVCFKCVLPRSGSPMARSWLKVGEETKKPVIGDIVVLWRGNPDGWQGHVGFFISENDTQVYILGGNQNNQVCILPYPKYRVLSYRKLI